MADRVATGKGDGPAKALRVFAEAGREPVDARTLQGKEALFVDGRPDGPDVGIATQHRKGVEFELALLFDLSNKAVHSEPDLGGGVFHPLRVFQSPEALVSVLHGLPRRSRSRLRRRPPVGA